VSVSINEEVAAQLLLKDMLEADSTLMGMVNGIALRSVHESVAVPFVKIDRQDASDLMVINMTRVWSNLTYLVRGIDAGPYWDDVQAIANRIDQVLHRGNGSNTTVSMYGIRRIETFTDETVEGPPASRKLYVHAGGIYELYAQAL
jgi:hypothetical protein